MMNAKTTLKNFLRNWKNQFPKKMFFYCTKTWKATHKWQEFSGKKLSNFELIKETENGPVCDWVIKLNGELISVRLICEKEPYEATTKGTWGVNPASFKTLKTKDNE